MLCIGNVACLELTLDSLLGVFVQSLFEFVHEKLNILFGVFCPFFFPSTDFFQLFFAFRSFCPRLDATFLQPDNGILDLANFGSIEISLGNKCIFVTIVGTPCLRITVGVGTDHFECDIGKMTMDSN